jgi:hypothetical protein
MLERLVIKKGAFLDVSTGAAEVGVRCGADPWAQLAADLLAAGCSRATMHAPNSLHARLLRQSSSTATQSPPPPPRARLSHTLACMPAPRPSACSPPRAAAA